jgi:hypothetical protein
MDTTPGAEEVAGACKVGACIWAQRRCKVLKPLTLHALMQNFPWAEVCRRRGNVPTSQAVAEEGGTDDWGRCEVRGIGSAASGGWRTFSLLTICKATVAPLRLRGVGSDDLDLGMRGRWRTVACHGPCAAIEKAVAKGAKSCGAWARQRPEEGVVDGGGQQAEDDKLVEQREQEDERVRDVSWLIGFAA